MRTYRPVPVTVRVSVPPVPVVVWAIVVHVVPSLEVWIWYALPYALSHWSTTWLIVAVAPRSTWIHCGSLNWLDHRVVVSPSTALEAAQASPSVDEAVA